MSTDLAVSLFPPAHQRWLRWLTVSTILIAVAMLVLDHQLKTTHAPLGIISLQLAGAAEAAKLVVYDWDPTHRLAAAFGLGLDYLFLCSYGAWMFFGCRWAAARWLKTQPSRSKLMGWASWLAIPMGLLDGAENLLLLIFLQSDGRSVLYPLAFSCALAKFGLILLLIGIWISGTMVPREGTAAKPVPPKKP